MPCLLRVSDAGHQFIPSSIGFGREMKDVMRLGEKHEHLVFSIA